MVGGVVVESFYKEGNTVIIVQDTHYRDRCKIVVEGEQNIEFGDRIWWQSSSAYWTTSEFKDRKLRRIGGSVAVSRNIF